MLITVFDIVEPHGWGDQVIATVWDELQAVDYCRRNTDCEVRPHDMDEQIALQVAE